MDISSTANTYQSSPAASAGGAIKTLGKEDFLKLFTVQLRAQNPLNPLDSTGFTAQLAQFSSLEQLTNIDTELKTMLSYQSSLQNTMTTSLIGKKVTVAGNTVALNGQAELHYFLPQDASKTTIAIRDASGGLVRQMELAGEAAGTRSASWDGKDQNGATLPPGAYTFTVEAVNNTGQAIGATTLTTGTVTGVVYENNMTYLSIDNAQRVQLGDILEIGGV